MSRRSLFLASLVPVLVLSLHACGSGNGSSASAGGAGPGGSSGSMVGAGGADASDDGLFTDHGPVIALVIDPPSAAIDIVNGAVKTQQFNAVATFQDNTTGNVTADWTFDHPEVGLVSPSGGLFTPSGIMGGLGTLTATVDGLSATAAVTVNLHDTENPANTDPTTQVLFDTPDNMPSGTLLYPYDQTVFARGIGAPDLMWQGGAAGDIYLVHLSETYYDVKVYTTADPPSGFLLPDDVWSKLTTSNAGEPVVVDILRASGGVAHAAMHETWKIAQGSLRGSIYYWAVNTGQLMKIGPGAKAPSVVFDSGPADQLGQPAPAAYDNSMPPWESGGNNKRCVACHTVSKDGSTLASVFEKKGSTASPWGTVDLTANPPGVTQITPYNSSAIYLALSPDGGYAVHNDVNFTLHLNQGKTGTPVVSMLDGITKVADPVFSPDGKLFAFASNVAGFYPVEYTAADLDVMDFDPMVPAFANRRTIMGGNGTAIAFPSFSPDSAWVLYQRGDYSRAKYGNNQVGHNELYMADVAKAVGEIKLGVASGDGLDARNQQIAYQPTVNPISVGGYTWVVFVSPRDYGNKMLSSTNPTYENRKQLWVAAVDANPQPGKDPSHPAFWLPAQDLSTINMSGYWALEPCHQNGNSCDQGYECCSGFCQQDQNGNPTCVPTPGGCSQIGDKCTTTADCCGGGSAKCIGGVCAQGQPN